MLFRSAKAAIATNPGVPPEAISIIKEIININPLLAPDLTKTKDRPQGLTVEEVVVKISPSKAADIDKDALEDARVVRVLSQQQLGNIIRSGTQQQISNIKGVLETTLGQNLVNINNAIATTMKELKDAKQVGDKNETKRLQTQLGVFKNTLKSELAKPTTTKDQKDAYERMTTYNQIVGSI